MNMKHTPGPWEVVVGDETADWELQWPNIESATYTVVGTEGMYGDRSTDMANAYLISAAPDLLDACQALYDHFISHGGNPDSLLGIKVLEALKKAKGE